jgi:putative transposase
VYGKRRSGKIKGRIKARGTERKAYPSDVTDKQWQEWEGLIAAVKSGGRPAKWSRHEIYHGEEFIDEMRERTGITVEIVERDPSVKGFKLLPYLWVVERTFAWLSGYCRLSRDYEFLVQTSDAMIYAAMVHLMLRRLAPNR